MAKSGLIGKLEGPEVVTDAAKWPKSFKEAPQLAELVKAGKLPPVAERIGQDPLVIKPLQSIGKYGGTWRAGFTGRRTSGTASDAARPGPPDVLGLHGRQGPAEPGRGLEMQDGGKAWLVHLRRGMKWSDGKPFTADDFVFWFEDIYRNKDLVPTPSATLAINGKQGVIEKVDTHTVRYKFAEPYFMLPTCWPAPPARGPDVGVPRAGRLRAGPLPETVPSEVREGEELDKKAKDAKFDSWVRYFLNRNDWATTPTSRTVAVEDGDPINTATWTLERNPYSVFVDTAGNQLPTSTGRADARGKPGSAQPARDRGGVRLCVAARRSRQAPVLLENQQKGNYKVTWIRRLL